MRKTLKVVVSAVTEATEPAQEQEGASVHRGTHAGGAGDPARTLCISALRM